MIVLPIRVNYQQEQLRLELDHTDRVPPLFSRRMIHPVRCEEAILIVEDRRGHLKRDPIVLKLIPSVLRLVPFVAHIVYT